MKKLTIALILLSLLITVFPLASCGEKAQNSSSTANDNQKAKENKDAKEDGKAEKSKEAQNSAENSNKDEKEAEQNNEKAEVPEKADGSEDSSKVDNDYHIGLITATISQSEDAARAAEALIEKYGEVSEGGRITHVTFPDNFASEMEVTIGQITSLADDPKMKIIAIVDAIPGTTAAFKLVREKRPDILLLSMVTQEDPQMIEDASDMIADPDQVTLGYLIPRAAELMGAKTFVHVSFPRHMSIELLSLRHDIMEASCKLLGIEFYDETAPDPVSDVGTTGAQQYILEKVPEWIDKYGEDTAFFCTNDSHTEPLLKMIAEHHGIFVQQDLPSPILGYPGAFGLDLKEEAGDFKAILKKTEEAVVAAGGSGRMGTWAYSLNYTGCLAIVEYGMRCVEGKAKIGSTEDLVQCYRDINPDAGWNGFPYVDRNVTNPKNNHAMVYQDLYVFGKGFMGLENEPLPDVMRLLDAFKEGKIKFGQREFEGVGPKD